jgi:hypothetical protein
MDVLKTALQDLGDEIIRELERRQPQLPPEEHRKTQEALDAARAIMAAIKQDDATRKRKRTRTRT